MDAMTMLPHPFRKSENRKKIKPALLVGKLTDLIRKKTTPLIRKICFRE